MIRKRNKINEGTYSVENTDSFKLMMRNGKGLVKECIGYSCSWN